MRFESRLGPRVSYIARFLASTDVTLLPSGTSSETKLNFAKYVTQTRHKLRSSRPFGDAEYRSFRALIELGQVKSSKASCSVQRAISEGVSRFVVLYLLRSVLSFAASVVGATS